MLIIENSLFIRFFLSLWLCLRNAAANSVLRWVCGRLGGWFPRQAENNAICAFVWREGYIPRAQPHSITCCPFTAIINVPCALFKAAYRAGKRVRDTSLFCRPTGALDGASFLFPGLFTMIMLMTPHAMWNDVYGLMSTVALTGLFVVDSVSRSKHRLELDALGPYMILYMAFTCITLADSLSTRPSLRFFVFHLTDLLLVLLVASMVCEYGQPQFMVALVVLGLSVAAFYGCYQSYVSADIMAPQQDMNLNRGTSGRVCSFFDNPNSSAEQLAMLLPLNLALSLDSCWRGKLLFLLSLGIESVTIGAACGRASRVGLVGAVLVFLALLNWRWVLVFLLVGLATASFLPRTICNRILTIFNVGEDSLVQYRFGIYEATKNLMGDYWMRGVSLGANVMKKVFQIYPTSFDGSYPVHTYNNYPQMRGGTGVLGLLAYLSLLPYQLKSGVEGFYAALDPRVERMMAATVDAFCGILVTGVAKYIQYYLRDMSTYQLLFDAIGACIKLVRMEQDKQVA